MAKKRERKVTIQEPVGSVADAAVVEQAPALEAQPEPIPLATEPAPEPVPVPLAESPAPAPQPASKRLLNARPGIVVAGPLTFGPGDCFAVSEADLAHPRVQRALAVGLLVRV